MTGMGRARKKFGSSYITIEIKSVNHRFCEVHTKLPSRFQTFEIDLTRLIKKQITRGKLDLWVGEEVSLGEIPLNKKALSQYWRFLKKASSSLKLKDPITLSHLQNGASYWMVKDRDVKKYAMVLKSLTQNALQDLLRMRQKEGEVLAFAIRGRLEKMEELHKKISEKKEEVFLYYKTKLEGRLQKILGEIEVDQSKLANEIAFLADRSDISEELERLVSHFSQAKKLLSGPKSSGRSLDFLIQEMNREWNTVASKSQSVAIAHWVVEAKSELEKIREQVQNIE